MARLIISERRVGEAVILDLSGDIIWGEVDALRQPVRRLIGEGNKRIYLNLKDVGYLDSCGIGELISTLIAINREEDGHLKLLNPTARIHQLLKIAKLLTVFDVEYDEYRGAGR